MTAYLRLYGERLVELGYTVLPIKPGSKRPDIKDWPRHATTAANVVAWYSNGRAQHGVGINARNTPAIDVDVLDPAVAGAMADAIDAIFPGHSLLIRTGMAPKFLIPFRSDEPFRKLVSQTYTDGKNDHKVEILGDGQQWVAYAIHPDTERPYDWHDGIADDGIRSVSQGSLPQLTRADAQRVVDAFELLAAERVSVGAWSLKAGALPLETTDNARVHDDPFAAHSEPLTDLSRAQVETLIHKLDFDERKDWVRAGMMLHHQYNGGEEGFEIWNAWGANSSKWNEKDEQAVWDSFGQRNDAPETLRGLIKQFGQPPKEKVRLPNSGFVQAADFASAQKVEWHIKHVLPKHGLIVIYGEPGSSKSFFALDMVAHVARGLEWRGHRTKQANVAYIAAEGVAGFGNRLAAYAKHNEIGLDDLPVFVRGGAFELKEDYLLACDEINDIGNVGLVVIDTLAAVTPGGNENTSEDMGSAIDAAQRIIESTGASVILIHHTNNQGALRGWSGLRGAVDNQIRIENDKGLRTASIEKQKEGQDGKQYGYRLAVIDLYVDEDGDAVTSCAIVDDEETTPNSRGAKKGRKSTAGDFETSDKLGKARAYLQIIEELVGLGDANVDESEVVCAIQEDENVNPLKEPDHPRPDSIKRTLLTLADKGKIKREGRWIRVCR